MLEVKNWKKVALDGDELAKLLKEIRAHQGLSNQWWWWLSSECVSYPSLAVGIISTLRSGRFMLLFPAGARDFYLLQNVQAGSRTPHSLLLKGYQCSFPGVKRSGSDLTTHLYLVPRLRTSGAVPPIWLHDVNTDHSTSAAWITIHPITSVSFSSSSIFTPLLSLLSSSLTSLFTHSLITSLKLKTNFQSQFKRKTYVYIHSAHELQIQWL